MKPDKILKERLEKTRAQLSKKKISLFLISNPVNIAYLTLLQGLSSEGRDAYLLLDQTEELLLIHSPLLAPDMALKDEFKRLVFRKKSDIPKAINSMLKKLKTDQVFFEPEDLRMSEYSFIQENIKAKLKPTSHFIGKLRQYKDSWEIKAIKKACQITSKTWNEIKHRIKPGLQELQVAQMLADTLRKFGADGIPEGFTPIVAAGENSAIPHHQSSNREIKEQDVVLVDFGCQLQGYCSDMTRTIQIGKQREYFRAKLEAVKLAYQKALEAVGKIQTLSEIDQAARKALNSRGLANLMPHATGHGLGLEIHELPKITKDNSETRLKPNMVITIEPGIYLPNKFGVRFENTILTTQSKPRTLT